ncbi:hypothetical protein T4A_6892 [Trichinella pseudospiralis]|uniref:Uncharacterized protein n=1 Tax=Trichinella pseudospiralis TaxID=6337 RepID=A0A0V1EFS8_TRIPS|nr:hypothetical protein T4A_6892 [Trichinella pseudospiralis]
MSIYAKLCGWLIASHPNIEENFHSSFAADILTKQIWLQSQITSKQLTVTTAHLQQTRFVVVGVTLKNLLACLNIEARNDDNADGRSDTPGNPQDKTPPTTATKHCVPFPKAQDHPFQLEISAAACWTSVIGRDGQLVVNAASSSAGGHFADWQRQPVQGG